MEPLPRDPISFKEIVEADLRRGARLIIAVQDEIDPQVRIATPEGDYAIAVTLPKDEYGRGVVLRVLSTFMVWKKAVAFVWTSELAEPDCVYAVGIARSERHACLSRIRRDPRPWTGENFGGVEWLAPSSIDPALLAVLPVSPRALTPKDVAACESWFGVKGRYPAVHVPSGEVRGLERKGRDEGR